MTKRLLVGLCNLNWSVPQGVTVRDAIEQIRSSAGEVEDLHNVFIVDDGEKLVGVLPLRKLILASPEHRIEAIMDAATIKVTPGSRPGRSC